MSLKNDDFDTDLRVGTVTRFGGMTSTPRTLVDIFRATVRMHPLQPAIRDRDESINYQSVLERVKVLASTLREQGVGPGRRVGIRMSSGKSDLYIGILAILFAGGSYVPVDREDSEERARTVFDTADVYGVLDDQGFHLRRPPVDAASELTLDDDAWVIFTSGSTGTPKGVAITHRSAAALVDAEARTFPVSYTHLTLPTIYSV